MRQMLSAVKVSGLFVLCALAGTASADSVSGQFTLGDQVLKPTEVAAFRIRDSFNARSFNTYVMLTTTPVNREAIAADTDPYAVAINDDAVRDSDSLSIFVEGSGETSLNAKVGGVQYVDSSGTIMGQPGSLIANCSHNSAERIACSVKVAAPVKSMDGPAWTIDVSFDAAVLSRAAGAPIAADGGEPGKAFTALVEAAGGEDLARITSLLSADEASNYQREYNTPEENLAEAKSTLGFKLPKQPRITGGEMLSEDHAMLEVEGVPYEGAKMLYLVEMKRDKGRWGFEGSSMAGMLD